MKTASADGYTAVRLPDVVFAATSDLLRALYDAHQVYGVFVADHSFKEKQGDGDKDVPSYVRSMWRDICTADRRPCIIARISGKIGERVVSVGIPKQARTKPIIAWAGLVGGQHSILGWRAVAYAMQSGNVITGQSEGRFDLYIPEPQIESIWTNGFLRMCREEWRDILKVGVTP